ncbi:MAG: hypothetical protein R6X06_01050 [Gammaproteobacteria bacterium]
MPRLLNPQQLVLRRDTATGLLRVGWETDMPVGRFAHLRLICEVDAPCLPPADPAHEAAYQAAMAEARRCNQALLEQQAQQQRAQGWHPVPPTLSPRQPPPAADEFGNATAAAMQLCFALTHNVPQAWAVLDQGEIVHVRARRPQRQLDALAYQVWYHQQQRQLHELGAQVLTGRLQVCASGLWFVTTDTDRD